MRAFVPEIIEHLAPECGGDPIHFVGLGMFDFQISFNNVRLQSTEKMRFQIERAGYEWAEGPSDAPVWRLIGQVAKAFELRDRMTLRLNLQSGDFIEFVVSESPFESFLADFGMHNGKRVLEIY
jgi:hypothetical protein